jgi:superfamily I DNA/RNA helicase
LRKGRQHVFPGQVAKTVDMSKRQLRQLTLDGTPLVVPEPQPKRRRKPGDIELTDEQKKIVDHVPEKMQFIIIEAYAGTGKTSTFEQVAKAHRDHKFLYIVFNKSMAKEAEARFARSKNVIVRSTYGLAFRFLQTKFERIKLIDSLSQLKEKYKPSSTVASILNRFWQSTDKEIALKHHPRPDDPHRLRDIEQAELLWFKMCNGELPWTHAAYLKFFTVTEDAIEWLEDWPHAVLLDEAQDSEPALMHFLMRLRSAAFYLVGDSCQNIYGFKNAVNAMQVAREYAAKHPEIELHSFHLTKSFRFGDKVAAMCSELLLKHKMIEPDKPLRGQRFVTRIQRKAGAGAPPQRPAYVCRTNAGAFQRALEHLKTHPNARPFMVGKILEKLKEFLERASRYPYGRDAYLEMLIQRAVEFEDQVEESYLRFIEQYPLRELPNAVRRLEASQPDRKEDATALFGTAHQFKGLEHNTVIVNDDFASLEELKGEEIRILYVALSRVKHRLLLPTDLALHFSRWIN